MHLTHRTSRRATDHPRISSSSYSAAAIGTGTGATSVPMTIFCYFSCYSKKSCTHTVLTESSHVLSPRESVAIQITRSRWTGGALLLGNRCRLLTEVKKYVRDIQPSRSIVRKYGSWVSCRVAVGRIQASLFLREFCLILPVGRESLHSLLVHRVVRLPSSRPTQRIPLVHRYRHSSRTYLP